uniref:Tyrosine specific protein phosphatases domain-containing protein n=1 Tax=Anopheles atroparvus TaxID=41427 RepID=A0A182IRV7_ANOAO
MDRRDYSRGRVFEDFMRCIDPDDDDADIKRRIEASTPILCHRLYFAVLSSGETPKLRNARTRFFSIDDKLVYQNFYNDFGPLNIAMHDLYYLSLADCLSAMAKAHHKAFFNFSDFDVQQYQHYERVENGDLNWIIPGKFLAFCGPQTGLGRTGTLIGAYLIKHFDFNSMEAIAWLRICRPGSVIGQQQQWLQGKEQWLIAAGNAFRRRNLQFDYNYGIYSLAYERSGETNASGRQDDQVLTTKVHSMRLDEESYEDAAKKANLINNNSLPNTDRPSSIASRLRSKSLSGDSRIASHRPQCVRQKPKARGTSLPVRNDKVEAGLSRRRKSNSIVVEQSPGSTQGESLNKIKAMRSKCMATLPETTTPTKETILASNITQPSPLPSSDSILQALKSSPSPETIPAELHSPTNLASKIPVQTSSMEVKVRPPDAAPQATPPSANSPVALKRSSSLETLPWNENDESAGHAETPNESFGEDSIDDTVDVLIPVVDVRFLGKKPTERPRITMKLAESSSSQRRTTRSRENAMPARDKVDASLTRRRKGRAAVVEQRPGISDVKSNKVTRHKRMSPIPEKSRSEWENAMPARKELGAGLTLRSLAVVIEPCHAITNLLDQKATGSTRLTTIPEKSCPATPESIVEVKKEPEHKLEYEASLDSIPTLNESIDMESLGWVAKDESKDDGYPVIVAVHGPEELKLLLAGIIDEDDADAFAPNEEKANIVDPQCSQPFQQPEAVPEQELLQPPPAKPPKTPAPKRSRSLSQEIVRGKGAGALRTGSDHAVVEGDDGPCSGHLARRRLRLRSERQRHDYTHPHLRSCR